MGRKKTNVQAFVLLYPVGHEMDKHYDPDERYVAFDPSSGGYPYRTTLLRARFFGDIHAVQKANMDFPELEIQRLDIKVSGLLDP